MKQLIYLLFVCTLPFMACKREYKKESGKDPIDTKFETTFMTLDPGHFHAALVQKSMYKMVNHAVYVYGPEGKDIEGYLNLIEGYNTRQENPTEWIEKVYTGKDYLEKMISEKPGNVMVVSGRNNLKIDYIKSAIDAGINVYADKPIIINPEDFNDLEEVFQKADQKNLLVYDIMTERFEINSILQRAFSMSPEIFGELIDGTVDNPAITKESVHHFFKYVSGKALKRPEWFFDTKQRGEGLTDVSTHLVDLIQWEAFPNQILYKSDIEIIQAKRWATELTKEMFKKVTGSNIYPDFLKKSVNGENLNIYCNGSTTYKIKGKIAKTSVTWNFQAPEGTGDTHYSIMRGTISNLIIKQGEQEQYKPKLYIKINPKVDTEDFEKKLNNTLRSNLFEKYPGLKIRKINEHTWTIDIPQALKVNHEGHFRQVTENYLKYLENKTMPEWEVPNMIVKYYTTTEAYKFARKH